MISAAEPSLGASLLLLVLGLGMLVAGGEALISGAVHFARRQGMSSLLIGLTVIAFGTSMPELFVSVSAAMQAHPDLMVGNVVGSNIANIGLILGLMVVLAPVRIRLASIGPEMALVVLASLAVGGIAWWGAFSRFWGLLFVAVLTGYTISTYRKGKAAKAGRDEKDRPESAASRRRILLLLGGGLVLLGLGSDIFIDGAVGAARHFKVPELIIGLTLAAIGTSLPELASSLSAIRRREGDLIVGNVVGSNLFNLLMVMGSTGLITPFGFSPQTVIRDLPVMIGLTVVLVPILYYQEKLSRLHGVLFLLAYGGYLFALGAS